MHKKNFIFIYLALQSFLSGALVYSSESPVFFCLLLLLLEQRILGKENLEVYYHYLSTTAIGMGTN
jgi:hypothetical protein